MKRHARIILIVGAVGGVLGLAYGLTRPRQHVASARFRAVAGANAQQSALSALGAQFGIASFASASDAPEWYTNVVSSRDLLRELGSRQFTLRNPEPFTGDLYAYFKIKEGKTSVGNIKLVEALKKRIKTDVDRPTGIITFAVSTPNPELSEAIAVAALELLNQFDINRRRDQARAEREFVERRLAEERTALAADENTLTNFYIRNRQVLAGRSAGPALNAEEARLQRRVQFSQQVYLALAQSLARTELEESRNTPIIAVLEHPQGFVERRPRGTLRLAVILTLLGLGAGVLIALVREYRALLRGAP